MDDGKIKTNFQIIGKTVIFTISQNNVELSGNAQQTGNVLRILNVRPENSGVYSCVASNVVGSDQKATVIDVERKCC